MKNILAIIKNHEFISVIVLCIMVICLISIGFGINSITNSFSKDIDNMSDAEIAKMVSGCPTQFSDNRFLLAVSQELDCPVSELTEEKLSNVESLKITEVSTLVNIEDISLFPNLKTLTISDCGLIDITALKNMDNLEKAILTGNEIRDVSAFSYMKSLTELDISSNNIFHIDSLSSKSIKKLIAADNKISNISAIVNLSTLEEADFSDNLIYRVPYLTSTAQLTILSLRNNMITDVAFAKYSRLKYLDISFCKVTDIKPLASCNDLEELRIYGYKDMDLSPLHRLPDFCSIFLNEEFDRSAISFMNGKFKQADKYTKVYIVADNRGLETNE